MSTPKLSRRGALGGMVGAAIAGSSLGVARPAAQSPGSESSGEAAAERVRRIDPTPGEELTNSAEFGEQAQLVLPPEVFATIAGGEREPFNRMSFRPRANMPGTDLDLSVTLFGEEHFTPVMIGPIGNLRRYHPEAELAMVRGAAAARAGMIVSSSSSVPLKEIKANAYSPLWYSVYSESASVERARAAAGDGASVIVLSLARPNPDGTPAAAEVSPDWNLVSSVSRAAGVPVVVKGVMSPEQATAAFNAGAQGVMVSTHGDRRVNGRAPTDVLRSVVDAAGGRGPVLVDGSVQRGTDALKALLLGARGVVVSRPAVWALAAYGADGVLWLIDLIQNELARSAVMVGVQTVPEMTPGYVKVHSRATA